MASSAMVGKLLQLQLHLQVRTYLFRVFFEYHCCCCIQGTDVWNILISYTHVFTMCCTRNAVYTRVYTQTRQERTSFVIKSPLIGHSHHHGLVIKSTLIGQ